MSKSDTTSMTTPNDAPRPTSELVKQMQRQATMKIEGLDMRVLALHLRATLKEAAASLQSLEARNKELEGALAEALDTIILPHLFDKDSLRIVAAKIRAALHPATKTEER